MSALVVDWFYFVGSFPYRAGKYEWLMQLQAAWILGTLRIEGFEISVTNKSRK